MFNFLILCVGLFAGSHAWAQRAHCSYGFQDSSCGPTISTAAQAAPQCPGDPGWTTGTAAQWQGSRFSSPQCNYQPKTTCPAGYSTVSDSYWNGSSWVGLACAIPPPPGSGSCQYGFLSGPTWTGSSWSYTCNAPPPPSNPAPSDPIAHCKANAAAAGYTVPPGLAATTLKIGSYTQVAMCYVTGPYYAGGGPNGGTDYEYACFFKNSDGSQYMPDQTMIWSYCQGYSSN